MSERIYKKIEIVGTSTKGVDDAIRNAIETANKTVSAASTREMPLKLPVFSFVSTVALACLFCYTDVETCRTARSS